MPESTPSAPFEPIVIVDYDPAWPLVFEQLRATISAVLEELAVRIEHVGSTAVPELPAKPIIDIDVVIESASHLSATIERLSSLGYVHRGCLGIPDREAFDRPDGTPPHHLYVCTTDSAELRRHVAFRDYLRAHPQDASAYGLLKKSLAVRFRNDRDAYTDCKTTFISEILQRAAS